MAAAQWAKPIAMFSLGLYHPAKSIILFKTQSAKIVSTEHIFLLLDELGEIVLGLRLLLLKSVCSDLSAYLDPSYVALAFGIASIFITPAEVVIASVEVGSKAENQGLPPCIDLQCLFLKVRVNVATDGLPCRSHPRC